MAWQYPISTNTQVNLDTTDSVYVGQYVTIGVSSSSEPAIYGTGSHQTAIINGTVAGWDSIALGNGGNVTSDETVQISKTGNLFSDGSYCLGVYGYSSSISNGGTVHGHSIGAYLSASHAKGFSTITNSGLIEGDSSYGVLIGGTQSVHLTNTGTIEGGTYSFYDSSTNDIRIVNKGTMTGAINLGNGGSIYDGTHGHVSGTVTGGAGGDRIYGGTEHNAIVGGGGDDFIWGGKGADMLTGGAQADIFVFTTGDGKDEVTDFNRAEGDSIDVHNWKAVDTFSNLKSHAKNDGDDVWITSRHDTLVIDGMHVGQLKASDFHF